jgi:hypothetical protein
LDGNNVSTEDARINCLRYASPISESTCFSLPEKYSSFQDYCLLNARACDKISDANIKAQCAQRVNDAEVRGLFAFVGFIAYLLLPLIGLVVIVKALLDIIKKKITKKRVLLYFSLLILVLILWFFVTVGFCFPPCFILY